MRRRRRRRRMCVQQPLPFLHMKWSFIKDINGYSILSLTIIWERWWWWCQYYDDRNTGCISMLIEGMEGRSIHQRQDSSSTHPISSPIFSCLHYYPTHRHLHLIKNNISNASFSPLIILFLSLNVLIRSFGENRNNWVERRRRIH